MEVPGQIRGPKGTRPELVRDVAKGVKEQSDFLNILPTVPSSTPEWNIECFPRIHYYRRALQDAFDILKLRGAAAGGL